MTIFRRNFIFLYIENEINNKALRNANFTSGALKIEKVTIFISLGHIVGFSYLCGQYGGE